MEHAVIGGQDRFLILHNDGAVNFTLVQVPVSTAADPATQQTLIPGRDDVRLDSVDAFARHLVVGYRAEACLASSCGRSATTVMSYRRRRSRSTPS